MVVWNSLVGTVKVRITSAAVERLLALLNENGLTLNNVVVINELNVEMSLLRTQLGTAKRIVRSLGAELAILERNGAYWTVSSLFKRPVLLAGMLVYIGLVLFIPTRILFVQVKGNDSVPERLIIEQAREVGMHFGAARRNIRSEKIKNALLSSVPDLKWVGVNTNGCVAIIHVKERSLTPETKESTGVCSIVARCDGVIEEIVGTKGNLLCYVGQAVVKNQVLVSGYTDCGISLKATAAEGEIYARTYYDKQLLMPASYKVRTDARDVDYRFSLVLGKKYIKLYKDSGILDTECAKIYEDVVLRLPGGFALPLGIVKETLIFYDIEDRIAEEDILYAQANVLGDMYLNENMVGGRILSKSSSMQRYGDIYIFKGNYFCREMIGKVYNEEIVIHNDK